MVDEEERKGPLTGVSALVDLEILRSGKHFAAGRKRAGERLLSGVHPDVVDQLVLGLEGPSVAGAAEPKAGMGCALGSTDVIHRKMRHDVMHRLEHSVARLATAVGRSHYGGGTESCQSEAQMVRRMIRLYPEALHLLLDRRRMTHVPEECT